MKKLLAIGVLFVILLVLSCGGRKATISTSEDIGSVDVSHIGSPLTDIQAKLSIGYAHLQKKEYDDGMALIKEAYEMIEVTNQIDLPIVNSRIYLYKSLIFAETDLSAQARDELALAYDNVSQASSMLTDEEQKAKADELLAIYDELAELLQKNTGGKTMGKYEEAFASVNDLITLREGGTIEEDTEEESE